MILFTTFTTDKELNGITALQQQNLSVNLTAIEIEEQGFVKVVHSLEDLQKMNRYEQHLVMKDGDTVVGYLLAMTKNSRSDIPVLIPMFEVFEQLCYQDQLLDMCNFIVVGQVCIDKNYRGKGMLDKAYAAYKLECKEEWKRYSERLSNQAPV